MDTLIHKPRPIFTEQKVPKSVKVETPIGSIESDSGNHLIDIATIVVIIGIYFAMKKFYNAT